jgi:hypothetical protein
MTAPTEAEIREAVQKRLNHVVEIEGTHTPDWIAILLDPLRYLAPDPDLDGYNPSIWEDLRPSQAARLDALDDWVFGKADAMMLEGAERLAEYVVEARPDLRSRIPGRAT